MLTSLRAGQHVTLTYARPSAGETAHKVGRVDKVAPDGSYIVVEKPNGQYRTYRASGINDLRVWA